MPAIDILFCLRLASAASSLLKSLSSIELIECCCTGDEAAINNCGAFAVVNDDTCMCTECASGWLLGATGSACCLNAIKAIQLR